jgi:hypothetical protein
LEQLELSLRTCKLSPVINLVIVELEGSWRKVSLAWVYDVDVSLRFSLSQIFNGKFSACCISSTYELA